MTPRTYWLGWIVMATGFALTIFCACLYLGAKLDALLEVLRGR